MVFGEVDQNGKNNYTIEYMLELNSRVLNGARVQDY